MNRTGLSLSPNRTWLRSWTTFVMHDKVDIVTCEMNFSTSSVEQCFKKRMCPISHKWFKMFIKMKPDVFLPTWLTEIFFHLFSSSYCLRLRRPDCSRASCNSHGEVGRILDFSRLLMIRWITNIPICSTRPIKATLQFCDDVRIPDKAFLYFILCLFFFCRENAHVFKVKATINMSKKK